MVSSRPYRNGLPFEEAVRHLEQASGSQFDPVGVQCFISFAKTEVATVFEAAGTSLSATL
jgi:HD-GYP domain-containing protein (c-di-GMP phosphodiesterase class II)